MNKNRKYKKAIAAAMALTLGAASLFPAAAPVSAAENGGTGEIAVNPDIHYQTLEGWGTSLCWWGNVIGSWGDADWNGNGRPDREEIAELAFSPEYLNLNIVRYNVGGGDKEDTSIKRIEGIVPGWTEDMTGTKDGSGGFDADAFYSKTTEEMSDAGQLWMLEQANQYRYDYAQETGQENDIINEVFSNSPPYYMTKSGTSTGGYSWDLNNLRDDCYDDFALYMARATKWIDNNLESKFGEGVSFVEPMNEPDTNYWQAGSTKQEGCIFNTGELQSWMLWEMQSALNAEEFGGSLDDIKITGTDETALWNAINSFNRLNDDVKVNLDTISAHTYSGNDSERRELRDIAKSYDKGLWMSEVTKGGGSHYEGCHESMDAANTRSQSEGIMADLKYMQPTAWIAWLVADSEYECLQTNSNWGLLHAVFEEDGQPVPDYHTNLVNADGSRKDGIPGEGYWAVTKQFYTMMQYSKYLKAGYTMIDIADSNMCAAISPSGDELVIVAQNFGDDRNTTVDLSAFPGAETAELYRTSDGESCELVETQDVTDKVLDVTLPYNSVSTWVIRANDGSAVCDPDNYGTIVNADVVKPSEEWTSDLNKFSYEGSWGESADDFGGKYTTSETGSVTFTFDGDQAMIYGTKAPEGAVVDISVDGGEAKQISLAADNKTGDALICSTGSLGEGTHTVTISKAEGQGDRLVEINYAKVVTGTLEEKESTGEPEEPSEETDKSSLGLAITMAEKLEAQQTEYGCYTVESWAAVQTALDAARALMTDENASQEDVDNAFLELITACNLLENAVQRVGLEAAIEGAKAILADTEGLEMYTPESVEALRTALAEAEKVYAEESADQETVNAAARSLMDAVTSLVVVEQDTRLDILIQKAEELLADSDQYTAASVENLQAALDDARLVADNKDASDAEINEAYNALADAMTSLVRKADKSELKTALDKADAILADSGRYVEETIEGLQAAADAAQAVYDKEDAGASEVGEAVKSLVDEILKARLLGDVDGNGAVDSADSAEVLKYVAEAQELDAVQSRAADVNKDGAADSTDAAAILEYASEQIEEF